MQLHKTHKWKVEKALKEISEAQECLSGFVKDTAQACYHLKVAEAYLKSMVREWPKIERTTPW